ncbi:MAG: N-acetyltransferase [Acidobacteria bacterium]|nr:N-acetyltransferase [Acidobacteriota bacterium]
MLQIQPVRGRRAFREFIDYAYERNAADPHWIPPLRLSEHERLTPAKNPFFAHAAVELFLARRDDRDHAIVGRVAAIDDRLHNDTHRDNVAMFGFFEAEDAEAARALLTAAEAWATSRGRSRVRGPINPSLNESCGLLVDGFDTDSMLLMPHNPPEYATFIESAGYRKVKDLYAWLYDIAGETPPLITRLATRTRDRLGLAMRPLALSEFTREVERLRVIYCGAWERNWGFVPPTPEEFRRLATELKPIFDPRCAVCAAVDGRMVACAVAVPDINQALKGTNGRLFPLGLFRLLNRGRYITQMRLLLLGVAPEYRALGLYPLLLFELHRQVLGGPYRRVEFSWVLEDNRDINQPAEQAGARRYKTYRIYEKALG